MVLKEVQMVRDPYMQMDKQTTNNHYQVQKHLVRKEE
jgi:hypothetical protein